MIFSIYELISIGTNFQQAKALDCYKKVDKKKKEAAGSLEIHYDLKRLMNIVNECIVNHVINNATREREKREHGDQYN